MKNFLLALAASSALMAPVAQAAIFVPANTTAVFSGDVVVEKGMGRFNCTLTVTITTGPEEATDTHGSWSHAHSATASAGLSGAFPCGAIAVNGPADVDAIAVSGGTHLIFDGFSIVPPLSSGYCEGTIEAIWGGNSGSSRTIEVQTGLSDMTGVPSPSCKLVGVLTQTSGTLLEVYP